VAVGLFDSRFEARPGAVCGDLPVHRCVPPTRRVAMPFGTEGVRHDDGRPVANATIMTASLCPRRTLMRAPPEVRPEKPVSERAVQHRSPESSIDVVSREDAQTIAVRTAAQRQDARRSPGGRPCRTDRGLADGLAGRLSHDEARLQPE
jgi:hypothetical protein